MKRRPKCPAVQNGEVSSRGKASIEFYVGSEAQYYCRGYIDPMTDCLITTCENCRQNVRYAQEDLEKMKGAKT